MLKSESATFADGKICVTAQQFAALRGFKLSIRVGKTLGPVLATLAVEGQGNVDVSALKSVDVLPRLAEALLTLDSNEATQLAIDLLACVTVDQFNGKSLNKPLLDQATIDLVFTGNLKAMFQVVMLSLKVNFADFFDVSDLSGAVPQAPLGA